MHRTVAGACRLLLNPKRRSLISTGAVHQFALLFSVHRCNAQALSAAPAALTVVGRSLPWPSVPALLVMLAP